MMEPYQIKDGENILLLAVIIRILLPREPHLCCKFLGTIAWNKRLHPRPVLETEFSFHCSRNGEERLKDEEESCETVTR